MSSAAADSQQSRLSRFAFLGCMILFAVPFLLAGVAGLVGGGGTFDGASIVGLVFLAAGLLVLGIGVVSFRLDRRAAGAPPPGIAAPGVAAEAQTGARPGKSPLFTLGCMTIFGLPFVAGGVATITIGGPGSPEDGSGSIFAIGVGTVFILAGLGVIGAGISSALRIRSEAALRAAHPGSPWLWRTEWAGGRIPDEGGKQTLLGLGFALFWNIFIWPIVVGVIMADGLEASPEQFFLGFFALIGVVLLAGAVHGLLRRRKFRRSYFAMTTFPGRVGRSLRGAIETTISPELRLDSGVFAVRLACINKVTRGSGKRAHTSEVTRWESETRVPFAACSPTIEGGSMFPVSFEVPAELPQSNDEDPCNQFIWRLEARAELPGVDYHAAWQVPVY